MPRGGGRAGSAAAEGPFGRLKGESFRGGGWSGPSAAEFVEGLDGWVERCRSGRLGEFREGGSVVWDTVDGRRARLGLAVQPVQEIVRTPEPPTGFLVPLIQKVGTFRGPKARMLTKQIKRMANNLICRRHGAPLSLS
jgi:hypothetical protein